MYEYIEYTQKKKTFTIYFNIFRPKALLLY